MKRQIVKAWLRLSGAAMLLIVLVVGVAGQQASDNPRSARCQLDSGARSGKAQVNMFLERAPECEMFTAQRLSGTSGGSARFSAAEFFEAEAFTRKAEHFNFAKVHVNDTKPAQAQDQGAAEAQELAKKLANPVASLISLPMQSNFDFGLGTGSGWRYTLNVQPVIPIKLSENWNLISRTIVPIVHQGNVTGPGTSQSGLGDVTQSLFFSPNKTEPLIWAVGPVFLLPTATDAALGTQKWGVGPTALALKQSHGWTYGMLANHIWSVAGKSNRSDLNSTFLQPFLTYNTKDAWTYGFNTESSYDWMSNSWSVPVNVLVSKLVRFGKQPLSFGGGVKCWAASPAGGADNCGIRIVVTALFPKK